MSDFIYSTKKMNKSLIKESFGEVYKEEDLQVTYLEGTWGSLAYTHNIYNGFAPLNTSEFLVIVLGGPLLKFRDNSFISKDVNNEGTQSIFQRWFDGEINWDEDLSGPFHVFIINKINNSAYSVTDIMSFIPVFSYEKEGGNYISSHVDILAKVTDNRKNIDEVSVVDFILHGVVTYPYTFYNNIKQLQPATIHELINDKCVSSSYWIPKEEICHMSIQKASSDVRNCLKNFVNTVVSETNHIAQFISGGEDSRLISGLLKNVNRDAFIYLDSMNREGNLAKKITEKYNATFNLRTRGSKHYLEMLPDCSDLVGTGSEYHHAHTYGFHIEIKPYDAVFGGLFSDALLKGSRIRKSRIRTKLPFLKDVKDESYSNKSNIGSMLFEDEFIKELNNRRQKHLNYIREFRNESAEEWFELWPSSMNRNIPNIHANRRFFKSYEPFLSNEIVKISATIKQDWKLNRKLFQKAAKPYLKESKWTFHGDGWLPYFSWMPNMLIYFTTWACRQVARRLNLIRGNQGPWVEWKTLIKSEEWYKETHKFFDESTVMSPLLKVNIQHHLTGERLSVLQYIALTQILYQMSKVKND